MKRTLHTFVLLAIASIAFAQQLPTKAEILEDLLKVNQYYMNEFPETESISTGGANWLEGSYFNGHMAVFELHPTSEAINYAFQWGKHNDWNIGNKPKEADNQCVGQAYMDIYYAYGANDDYMLAKVGTSVKNLVNRSAVGDWHWIDALYMAMPVLTRYGIHYQDDRYFQKLYDMYHDTKVTQNLYNPSVGLWYRDGQVLSGKKKKCYWSRGNGWVFGGHVRTLQYLPDNDSHRDEYIETFGAMAETLKNDQRSDGFWNASLTDPTYYPGPETSGTAFFVYGLAWGINAGILDKETYLPTVILGWNGLIEKALDTNGRIGYVQGVADEPKDNQPVTFSHSRHYGEGNFLLAGTEVIKLAEGELPAPAEFFVKSAVLTDNTTLIVNFFEPAEKTSAETVANYHINNDVVVDNAQLSADGMSCTLSVSNVNKGAYGISFENIKSISDKSIAAKSGKYFYSKYGNYLSSQELKQLKNISIYPNPVSQDYINLQFLFDKEEKVNVQLYTITGKLLLTKNYNLDSPNSYKQLNLANISKGIYILKVKGADFVHNKKIIKE